MKKNEVNLCSIYGEFFTTYPGRGGAWLCSDFDEQHAFSNFLFSPVLASIHIRIAASQTGRKAHSFYIRPQTLSFVLHFEWKTKFLSTDVLFTELSPSPSPSPLLLRRVYLSTIVRQCERDFNPRMVSGLEFYSSSSVNSPWKKDADLLRHVSADNCPLVRLQLKDIAQNCSNLNVYLRSRRFMRSSLMFFCDYVWSARYSTSIDDTSAILRREFLTFKSVNLAF